MSWIIDDVESVTVGSKNVALTVWDACDLFKDANGDGKVDAIDNKYVYPSAEIYPLFDDDNYVIAVVTIAENEGSTTNYAYITGDVNSEAYANDEYTWTLPAIVNGKKVELTEIGDTLDVLDNLTKGNWYKIKYDADGYVRGYEAIEGQITDGNYDSSDCYIDDVADLEGALGMNDTVLLDQYFANGNLSFENGTLYTDTAKTEGININPDVKVVLALADKNKKPFDDVDDTYTGYSGLEKALRNLDSAATNFDGNLAAIVEGGDGATTIILDDRSGKADPDYNPLKDMKVTVNLIDRTYFYPQVLSTVTDTLDQEDFKNAGGTITYTAAQFEGNLAGLDNYKAFPDKQNYSITRFEEGKEVSIDFYYRVEEEAADVTQIKINTTNAYVTVGGVQKGNGAIIDTVEPGDVLEFTVKAITSTGDDVTTVTDKDGQNVPKSGSKYYLTVAEGDNEINVVIEPEVHSVKLTAPSGYTIKNQSASQGVKGDTITFDLEKDTATQWTLSSHAVSDAAGAVTINTLSGGKDGTNGTTATTDNGTFTDQDDMNAQKASAVGQKLYLDSACKVAAPDEWVSGQTYYWITKAGVPATNALYKLSVTIGSADIDVTLKVD